MNRARRTDRRDDRRIPGALQAFEPVIRSTVGVVLESAGLLRNIAGLGLALISDAKAAPRPPVALPSNVVPFPTNRRLKQSK
jgi:hypothetical protein